MSFLNEKIELTIDGNYKVALHGEIAIFPTREDAMLFILNDRLSK